MLEVAMSDSSNENWLPDIITAVRSLGGRARLKDIYRWVERNRSNLPSEYQAVVRATIYAHSSDAKGYVSGNPDVFDNIARGEWGLRFPDETMIGRSELNLLSFVLNQFTQEDLERFAGQGEALKAELHRRMDKARSKYQIGDMRQ